MPLTVKTDIKLESAQNKQVFTNWDKSLKGKESGAMRDKEVWGRVHSMDWEGK